MFELILAAQASAFKAEYERVQKMSPTERSIHYARKAKERVANETYRNLESAEYDSFRCMLERNPGSEKYFPRYAAFLKYLEEETTKTTAGPLPSRDKETVS